MQWRSMLFGNVDRPEERDPFGRIPSDPLFDVFRGAWKTGAGLVDLFGKDPLRIRKPVGPEAPNRRPDVAKVETFLGRTGHLDLDNTDGPTGYYSSRLGQGIRRFQHDNALKVDGLINADGPTIKRIAMTLGPSLDSPSGRGVAARPDMPRTLLAGVAGPSRQQENQRSLPSVSAAGDGRRRRERLQQDFATARNKGRGGEAYAIWKDLEKLKRENPVAFGEWSQVPPPGKGLFLVDPYWGRPIPGADGKPIRPTTSNGRYRADLPPIPKGTPPFNRQGGEPEPVIIAHPSGEKWTAHNIKGEKHLLRSRVPITLTPQEAKHLGLEEYAPPEGGWNIGTDWTKLLELGKDALDVYDKSRRGRKRRGGK